MRDEDSWRPTKYDLRAGRLVPSRDRRYLAASSILLARLTAELYDDAFRHWAGGVLIDLGCGRVPFYAAYSPQTTEIICVDWPSSLHGQTHVDLWCDLSRRLPLGDAVVDTILSSDVLEHLPDPDLAFAEMSRILKPGGHLLLNTPFLYRVHEAPHDFLRHTVHSLERLATRHGFEVVRLVEIGGAIDVLADVVAKLLEPIPVLGPWWSRAVAAAAHGFGTTALGRAARRRTAAVFPLASFLVARRH